MDHFNCEDGFAVFLGRVDSQADAEIQAMWCFVQLSHAGRNKDPTSLAAPSKVRIIWRVASFMYVSLFLQRFSSNGFRRVLALSLLVGRPMPRLALVCADPDRVSGMV